MKMIRSYLKKLSDSISEFRTRFNKKQYRLLAFWDKTDKTDTLVIASHRFVKKTNTVDRKEINKAEKLMEKYFAD